MSLEKDKQVNFKTNGKMFDLAQKVFAEKKLDNTSAINLFLQYVATQKKLPFLTEEESEREILIANLQERALKNLKATSMSLEEMEQGFES